MGRLILRKNSNLVMLLDSCEELSNHYSNVRLYHAGGKIERQRSGDIQR